ncbi:MAG TPA: pyruvate kinase [Candidatus Omnitrophota bacterium]|nr:pyruvate kinase [Candidatus Omnitrophota bacterium]HPS20604.1 pyruvate kinase [Candidatus Omnitrophota bacterium]
MNSTRTRIVATLGPASADYSTILKLVLSGLHVVRLNFSHGTHAEHLEKLAIVRKINKKYQRHVLILQDLEGYRIRIAKFRKKEPKALEKKAVFYLVPGEDKGNPKEIPFDYKGDLTAIGKGQFIYIDDGNIILKVIASSKKNVKVEVVEGGLLKERKGVNMPEVNIPFSGVTAKDKIDLEFGIKNNVDFVAQSFVRTKKDILVLRKHIDGHASKCKIIAKIESREAIHNIDEIIDVSDGIMVARGDMGIAVPIYKIPIIQKRIIKKCNKMKKFVITATQMLEHMTEHSRPTRAEVTDVANAILDGTDYVMLSAESASGKYPVESVKMMDEIIKYTEKYGRKTGIFV